MFWSGATAIDTLSHLLLPKDSYKSQARDPDREFGFVPGRIRILASSCATMCDRL